MSEPLPPVPDKKETRGSKTRKSRSSKSRKKEEETTPEEPHVNDAGTDPTAEQPVLSDDDDEDPPPSGEMDGTFEPFWCRAIGDFEAQEAGDLTIRYGDMIEVLDMQANGWWAGQISDRVGWFPSNHVARVDPLEVFLKRSGLLKIYDTLVKEDVDMESLMLLTDEDLNSIGVKLGPRKQLLRAIDAERRAGHSDVTRATRDISHASVRKTLSVTTREGHVPDNATPQTALASSPAHDNRTSQFIQPGEQQRATEEQHMSAAVYLKVIVPEQNLYKILSFEGHMCGRDIMRKVASRLTKGLKKPLDQYNLYIAVGPKGSEEQMDVEAPIGKYKFQNMTVLLMRRNKAGGFLSSLRK